MTRYSFAVSTISALALAAVSSVPAVAGLTCYPRIPATMLTTVKSAGGFSGQVFRFKTTAAVTSNGILVPAGTLGYGIVLSAVPASNRARNGIVVLEARYLIVGGDRVQVTGDPVDASILTHGASLIGIGAGAIPVPGLGFVLDEAIQGTNIIIGPGYHFHVVPIGDLQNRGPCVQTAALRPQSATFTT
jgi:hypothetical protein